MSELFSGKTNKLTLRRWLEAHAPPYLQTKPKGYFHVPIHGILAARRGEFEEWRRSPGELVLCRAGVPEEVVSAVLADWLQGNRARELSVWAIAVLEAWLRAHA